MNKIAEGEVYFAVRVSSGTGKGKPWQMAVVADSGGNNQISVFFDNQPQPIGDGDKFEIRQINSVQFGFLLDKQGNWRPNCSVNAIVAKVVSFQEYFKDGNPFTSEKQKTD